jgi:aspartate kinase
MESEMADKKILVQKYGGSSVADVGKLRQVAARVASAVTAGYRVVVVVSAMGKTTDELLALARSVSPDPPRRELDMLLSTGERISMALLAMALSDLGHSAISFTGSQSGILTNDRHSGARIIEVRPVRIQDELERDKVVIVAGFQGMSYKREITTLGRGGSDTTAVALAAALGAEACEIYSDVDGVYSADPRVVPEARHLPRIGYEEMQELAEHGAKVLNAQAVEWARKAGIVIYARKTSGSERETVVAALSGGAGQGSPATAVTGTKQVAVLRAGRRGAALLAALAEEGAALRHVRFTGDGGDGGDGGVAVTLVRDDLPDWGRTERTLRATSADLQIDESQGTVTAVGPELGRDPRHLARVLKLLGETGIPVGQVDASPLRLCVWLPREQVDPATVLMHRALCLG